MERNMTQQQNGGQTAGHDLEMARVLIRQLKEDICAYQYDLEFCKDQMVSPDLTPHDSRGLQLRSLDLGHSIRTCQNRIELLQLQLNWSTSRDGFAGRVSTGRILMTVNDAFNHSSGVSHFESSSAATASATGDVHARATPNYHAGSSPDTSMVSAAPKRRRKESVSPSQDDLELELAEEISSVQRLGWWRCRLCTSVKYLVAGPERLPSAPCKWPLKDIGKMMTHLADMHLEHTPAERLVELGAALNKNRGPFKHWLRFSHHQKIEDRVIDECIEQLQSGRAPPILRQLSRAVQTLPGDV